MAKPGYEYTLCLPDGQYTGGTSMIDPPQNLSGNASERITVRALNDGKVRITLMVREAMCACAYRTTAIS